MENEKIEFALALNLANFKRQATVAVGKVQTMDRHIKKAVSSSSASFVGLKGNIAAIGVTAIAVTVGGLMVLKSGLQEVTEFAGEQEDAEIKLAGVIRATGSAAGYTLGQLRTMAGDLQAVTRTGDETTLSAMAVLATFKQIKGDEFKEATLQALNMSTVMGTDLKGSVIQVGKALNDPIKGMSALSKAGVTFTDSQKGQIAAMQKSGNIMGAQKIILEELRSEFGATAAAMRGNFKGGQIAISNAFGDMKEQAGFAITKNGFFLEAQKLVEASINKMTGKLKTNDQAMRDMAKNGALAVVDGAAMTVEGLRFIYNGYQGIKLAAHGAVVGLVKGAELTVKALRTILKPLDLLLDGLSAIGVIDSNPLANLEKSLNGWGAVSIEEFTKLYSKIEKGNAAFDSVGDKIQGLKEKLKGLSTEKVDIAENIQAESTGKTNNSREIKPRQYSDKSPSFQMINGQFVMPQSSGGKATTPPVDDSRFQHERTTRTVEINLNGNKMYSSEEAADGVIETLVQAGLSA